MIASARRGVDLHAVTTATPRSVADFELLDDSLEAAGAAMRRPCVLTLTSPWSAICAAYAVRSRGCRVPLAAGYLSCFCASGGRRSPRSARRPGGEDVGA